MFVTMAGDKEATRLGKDEAPAKRVKKKEEDFSISFYLAYTKQKNTTENDSTNRNERQRNPNTGGFPYYVP